MGGISHNSPANVVRNLRIPQMSAIKKFINNFECENEADCTIEVIFAKSVLIERKKNAGILCPRKNDQRNWVVSSAEYFFNPLEIVRPVIECQKVTQYLHGGGPNFFIRGMRKREITKKLLTR